MLSARLGGQVLRRLGLLWHLSRGGIMEAPFRGGAFPNLNGKEVRQRTWGVWVRSLLWWMVEIELDG